MECNMEESKISFEKELESSLKITELEQRLEMGFYCCDYPQGNRMKAQTGNPNNLLK
jgi:hypothetical protein